MSFLALYGVFLFQFLTLFILFFALCSNMKNVLLCGKAINLTLFKWFSLNSSSVVNFEIYLDTVSISFALLTVTIALFVLIYSFVYFRYEPNVDRLIIMISSFVWSMVLLVLSGNMFMVLLGWELIGLTSFLLINFWATRVGTLKAAFKAFTFNKFSDAALLFAIIVMSFSFHDLSISTILAEAPNLNPAKVRVGGGFRVIEVMVVGLLGAAFVKSAQVMGHLWLPDSMEAPVPASALIHSATLVSAGIFLVLRLYPIFEQSWLFYNVVPLVGAATAAYGGLVAIYQTDIKRLLAYSTISHCGFLMLLTTTGSVEHTIVYLYIHGFFKAISFLCVGNVIRFSKNYQDMRRMGSFWKAMPIELALLTMALLNLSGAPLFWGYVCKHLVLCSAALIGLPMVVWSLAILAALTGPIYSYKLLWGVFFDNIRSHKSVILSAGRDEMSSRHNTNTPLMGWLSIALLSLFAYIIIFFIVYTLVTEQSLLFDSASLMLNNQADNNKTSVRYHAYNFAVFSWLSAFVWVGCVTLKFGSGYNSIRAPEKVMFGATCLLVFYSLLRFY